MHVYIKLQCLTTIKRRRSMMCCTSLSATSAFTMQVLTISLAAALLTLPSTGFKRTSGSNANLWTLIVALLPNIANLVAIGKAHLTACPMGINILVSSPFKQEADHAMHTCSC